MKKIPLELNRVFDFVTTGMTPPNRVVFGFGAIEQIGTEAGSLVKDKQLAALVISDKTLEEIKRVDLVRSLLSSVGFTVKTFTEVEPEPDMETAVALHNYSREENLSLIVGLGGGSVMDLSKLIAQSIGCGRSPLEYFEQGVAPERKEVPLILVPTTAGTGSEVSPFIVVNIGHDKRFVADPYYYPDIAIVDPELSGSMPPLVTASTGIDALSHGIEGMLHKNANPFSDTLCLAGIEMAGAYLRRAVADGEDLEARYYMSMSATVSMMGMAMAGPLYAHSVSYVIPMYKSAAHGICCGLALPYVMSFNLPVCTAKLARIAVALGEKTWMHSELDTAKLAVDSVARLVREVGLPLTLSEYGGLNENDLEKMADQMIESYPRPMNPRPMGREESIKLWRNMWNGTL